MEIRKGQIWQAKGKEVFIKIMTSKKALYSGGKYIKYEYVTKDKEPKKIFSALQEPVFLSRYQYLEG